MYKIKENKRNSKKISKKLLASILKKSCSSSMNRSLAHIQNGWFKKGSRTQVKVKLGRENFYLYSAVNPKNGENSSLLAPNVNTDYMNVFLEQMSQYLGIRKAFLVMDCASWKKFKVPKNIEIIYLPPYSPDLNPVERFWLYIKQNVLLNKIYDTQALLESTLCKFLTSLELKRRIRE